MKTSANAFGAASQSEEREVGTPVASGSVKSGAVVETVAGMKSSASMHPNFPHATMRTRPATHARYRKGTAMTDLLTYRPIGHVHRDAPATPGAYLDPAAPCTLEILPEWESALTGLEGYSHLVLLFALDRAEVVSPHPELVHPEGRAEMPEVGLFATRSPHRPNPIALSCPRLLRRDGRVLTVSGTDAWDGSPILDLKGYSPPDDAHPEATVPAWLEALWELHREERG